MSSVLEDGYDSVDNQQVDLPFNVTHVWCSVSPSTLENTHLLYKLCRFIEQKNNICILSECRPDGKSGDNDITFQSDRQYVFPADMNQKPLEQDDIFQVEEFNYAVILHHLSERYRNKIIYTKMGPLWIAVNPYGDISDAGAEKQLISTYHQNTITNKKDVHLYTLLNTAVQNLSNLRKKQSIIITGGSGSGKTEMMKKILNFFLYNNENENTLINTSSSIYKLKEISTTIKWSNIILEAFGNSKTKKNDNSSGFIKLVTLYFDEENVSHFHFVPYLLRTELLVNRETNEQAFHIFYYIFNGANDEFKKKFLFRDIEYYRLLKNGMSHMTKPTDNAPDVAVSYTKEFDTLVKALKSILDNEKEFFFVFSTLSGILLLGNLNVLKKKGAKIPDAGFICELPPQTRDDYKNLQQQWENTFYEDSDNIENYNVQLIFLASKLLGLHPETLLNYIMYNEVNKTGSAYLKLYTQSEIVNRIQYFIRAIYNSLFEWLIMKINKKCSMDDVHKNDPYLNIIDIPYFAKFKVDSLEQLLHNTTVEGVMKVCIDFFYKKRLFTYKGEGVERDTITYNDNIDLYNILTKKEQSIFAFLESATINNMDKNLLAPTLIRTFKKSSFVKETNSIVDRRKSFLIIHSCGPISYKVEHFINTNINMVTAQCITLVKKSENEHLQELFPNFKFDSTEQLIVANRNQSISIGKTSKYTNMFSMHMACEPNKLLAVTSYRDKLEELINSFNNSFCHLMFCINPNAEKEPLHFEKRFVLTQLKIFNILQWSKLKNYYYPYIFNFNKFLDVVDYVNNGGQFNHAQNLENMNKNNKHRKVQAGTTIKDMVKNILTERQVNPNNWLLGKNMVFLNEEAVNELFHTTMVKWKERRSTAHVDSMNKFQKENDSTEISNANLSGSTRKSEAAPSHAETDEKTISENFEVYNLKKGNKCNTMNSTYTSPMERTLIEKTDNIFNTPVKKLTLDPIEETLSIDKKKVHEYGTLNLINSVTFYDKHLGEFNEALKQFKPINEQLKKDSIFSLGINNIISPRELFGTNSSRSSNDPCNIKENVYTQTEKRAIRKKRKHKKSKNAKKEKRKHKRFSNRHEKTEHSGTEYASVTKKQRSSSNILHILNNQQPHHHVKHERPKQEDMCQFDLMNILKDKIIKNVNIPDIQYCTCGYYSDRNFPKREVDFIPTQPVTDVDEIHPQRKGSKLHNKKKMKRKEHTQHQERMQDNEVVDLMTEKEKKQNFLNELNVIHICNTGHEELIQNNLRNIKNDMEQKYGNTWNIFIFSSNYYFKAIALETDQLIVKTSASPLQEIYQNTKHKRFPSFLNNDRDMVQEKIVEYLAIPEKNEPHEMVICNKVDKMEFQNNGYHLVCFRSHMTSMSERLEAKEYYNSIPYENQTTTNITEVNIHFSYMDEKMKKNFKQHVINEYIIHPDMDIQQVAQHLLQLAIHFYHEKVGSWCVFISDTAAFAGIINIVKNRYLRMSIKHNGEIYHVLLFESPI